LIKQFRAADVLAIFSVATIKCLIIVLAVLLVLGKAAAAPTISVNFTAPVSGAYIEDIFPITLTNAQYPALLILWAVSDGTQAVPIQLLSYDPTQSAYIDNTAKIISGPVPSILNPRNAVIAKLNNSGYESVVIANQGLDASPWPGTTDTLLLATRAGQLVDHSSLLPQKLAYSHDVSAGVINHSGYVGIFVNNIYSEPNTPPKFIIDDLRGDFTKSPGDLPSVLQSTYPAYTSSALVDVDGSGRSALVLGSEDLTVSRSKVYLNGGGGHFENSIPIKLPNSPLSPTEGLYSTQPSGPTILDIRPINISSLKYVDLVVVSTNGNYTGYAFQILINDGTGHFKDETTARVSGAPISGEGGSSAAAGSYWLKRAWVFKRNGVPDIVTEASTFDTVPSQVFKNDGTGHFILAKSVTGMAIANVAMIGGTPMLIETDYQSITLVPYP
jgi:hypothetical protein